MNVLSSYPRITPFLWFDQNAEEAVNFYVSIFENSRVLTKLISDVATAAPGKPLTIGFELDGQKFTALNGGPLFRFNESISFVVRCDSQDDIDEYWTKLTAAGGSPGQCGWLKDKFGLSWQIIPAELPDLIQSPNAMKAMMSMTKMDIAALKKAAGEP